MGFGKNIEVVEHSFTAERGSEAALKCQLLGGWSLAEVEVKMEMAEAVHFVGVPRLTLWSTCIFMHTTL